MAFFFCGERSLDCARDFGSRLPLLISRDPSTPLGIAPRGSDAAQTPQVKPRRADGTARESVWEPFSLRVNCGRRRKSKAANRNVGSLFLLRELSRARSCARIYFR